MTKAMLRERGIGIFGNNEFSEGSSDLNIAKEFGAFLKDVVESLMIAERDAICYRRHTLLANLEQMLKNMECATNLFQKLLSSYPKNKTQRAMQMVITLLTNRCIITNKIFKLLHLLVYSLDP